MNVPRWRRPERKGALALAALALGGCFLVNSNVTDFKFTLPPKSFTVDASKFGLESGGTIPVVACTSDADCSMLSHSPPAAFTCAAMSAGKQCVATVVLTLVAPVNLQQEDQSFVDTVKNNPVVSAKILDIEYTVAGSPPGDTLDFATPPINLSVAPAAVMDPTDPHATLFATIPALPAGFSGSQPVTFAAGGQDALSPYIANYSQTFNLIARGTMIFHGGDPTPSGTLTLVINSDAQVSCSGCQ